MIGLALLLPWAAQANTVVQVDARTGNLSVASVDRFTDVLEFHRTYNAQARERGVFGVGWGSLFETRLITFSDGTAAVRDGGHAVTYYGSSGGPSLTRDSQRIADLVAAREKLTPSARDYLVLKLNTSKHLRVEKTIEHGLPNVPLPQQPLHTAACRAGRLQPMSAVYLRTTCNGWEERFDLEGRLMARGQPGAQPVALMWEPDGVRVLRTGGVQDALRLVPGADGFVAQASVPGGTQTTYTHDAHGNLIAVEGAGRGPVRYGYAPGHLLTAIHHADGGVHRFEYRMDRRVVKVTEPSGQVVHYGYERGSREDRDVEQTTVTLQGPDGELQKDTAIERAWNGRSGKLLRYRDARSWHRFEYSNQGFLRTAYSSFGHAGLAYDAAGNLERLRVRMPGEESIQELLVEYGDDHTPLRIELIGRGVVSVQRGAGGEVAAVPAEAGQNDGALVSRLMHVLSVFRRIVMHAEVGALL